jgi:hypothetical protein
VYQPFRFMGLRTVLVMAAILCSDAAPLGSVAICWTTFSTLNTSFKGGVFTVGASELSRLFSWPEFEFLSSP